MSAPRGERARHGEKKERSRRAPRSDAAAILLSLRLHLLHVRVRSAVCLRTSTLPACAIRDSKRLHDCSRAVHPPVRYEGECEREIEANERKRERTFGGHPAEFHRLHAVRERQRELFRASERERTSEFFASAGQPKRKLRTALFVLRLVREQPSRTLGFSPRSESVRLTSRRGLTGGVSAGPRVRKSRPTRFLSVVR